MHSLTINREALMKFSHTKSSLDKNPAQNCSNPSGGFLPITDPGY